VVAVDDLQWLDRASARVLNFVLRRATARLGVLATFRLHAGDDPVAIDRAIATGDVEHLPVGPLPVETIERVIHARLGAPIPHPVAVRITNAAGGNPFFALEIARGLAGRAAPGPGEVLPIPENLLDLVEERLETLPAETRGALLIAAVASRPTERLIAETGTLSATDALRAAEVAGIVAIEDGRVVFVHPLF